MSYVNNKSYVFGLYELLESCKSYEYLYECLKITCFWFYKFGIFFVNIEGWKT